MLGAMWDDLLSAEPLYNCFAHEVGQQYPKNQCICGVKMLVPLLFPLTVSHTSISTCPTTFIQWGWFCEGPLAGPLVA